MFVRRNKGRKGTYTVQVVEKTRGKVSVVASFGTSSDSDELNNFEKDARKFIDNKMGQLKLFVGAIDNQVRSLVSELSGAQIQVVGPELILGKVFDSIGFEKVGGELFRYLVLSRLVFPGSKLRTVDYLSRFQGIEYSVSKVYRFLDTLKDEVKKEIEEIALTHVKKVLGEPFTAVFYDITTLYFETSREDDLRRIGYSKDGKVNHPQILVGLMVGERGFPIAFDVFEGNKFEGLTLIPFLEKNKDKLGGIKPVVIADAGLLNKENLEALKTKEYEYIIGARLRNESEALKTQILLTKIQEKTVKEFKRKDGSRLLVSFSEKRRVKDESNRTKGYNRLDSKIKSGVLTKEHINNRGYNKYLILEGNSKVKMNKAAFDADAKWDGLKGYVTNSKLNRAQILTNYKQLWHIEKAFRISKTDLLVRPIYHRKETRIRAHILIAFASYLVWKEVERQLYEKESSITPYRAMDLVQNIYQITYTLPESREKVFQLLKLSEEQQELVDIFSPR